MSEFSSKNPNIDRITGLFLDSLENEAVKPIYEMTPDEARDFLVNIQRKSYKEIPADVVDIDIFTDTAGSVSVRLVRPENYNEVLPVILYMHGGGWVMGDKEVYDMFIRKLAVLTNSVVAFVNYSRSPEAMYPTQLNQGYGVLEYLYKNPADFNIDADRIVVAGDSAGGNLAAAIALRAIREGGPKILYQALIYPVTDANMDSDSYKLFKDGPWLSKKAMEWFWEAYLPDKKMKNDLYVSPLKACVDDLADLPETLIITDENDVLRDEGEAYAKKLDTAGVKVSNIRINMTIHDFIMLNGLQQSEAVKTSVASLCGILKNKLHNE
uniref:alpha/beta hydrolase n=1 Tax=Candidatus Scatousia sp. TaxID=3085663 RepID=UPI00402835C8